MSGRRTLHSNEEFQKNYCEQWAEGFSFCQSLQKTRNLIKQEITELFVA